MSADSKLPLVKSSTDSAVASVLYKVQHSDCKSEDFLVAAINHVPYLEIMTMQQLMELLMKYRSKDDALHCCGIIVGLLAERWWVKKFAKKDPLDFDS